jgi:hypothetical protein
MYVMSIYTPGRAAYEPPVAQPRSEVSRLAELRVGEEFSIPSSNPLIPDIWYIRREYIDSNGVRRDEIIFQCSNQDQLAQVKFGTEEILNRSKSRKLNIQVQTDSHAEPALSYNSPSGGLQFEEDIELRRVFSMEEREERTRRKQALFRSNVLHRQRVAFNLPSNAICFDALNLDGLASYSELFEDQEEFNALAQKYFPKTSNLQLEAHHIEPGIDDADFGIPLSVGTHNLICPRIQQIRIKVNNTQKNLLTRVLNVGAMTQSIGSYFFYQYAEVMKDLKLKDGRAFVQVWYEYLSESGAIFLPSKKIRKLYGLSTELADLLIESIERKRAEALRR